jgi:hypothetical protein
MSSYALKARDILGVTGTVTITETSNTSASIDISLANAPSGITSCRIVYANNS